MALKIGPCPKCGNTTFIATAHVTQTWLWTKTATLSKPNLTAMK